MGEIIVKTQSPALTPSAGYASIYGNSTDHLLYYKNEDGNVFTVSGGDGWIPTTGSWTYNSSGSINIPSGGSALYSVGDKIKLTQSGSVLQYFYVIGVTNTTLNITGGSDYVLTNTAITNVYYSKASSPTGFPQWFNYTPSFTGFSINPAGVHRFLINGRQLLWNVRESSGSSSTSAFAITSPVVCPQTVDFTPSQLFDNGSVLTTLGLIELSGTTANLYTSMSGGGWTTSGIKFARFTVSYEI